MDLLGGHHWEAVQHLVPMDTVIDYKVSQAVWIKNGQTHTHIQVEEPSSEISE